MGKGGGMEKMATEEERTFVVPAWNNLLEHILLEHDLWNIDCPYVRCKWNVQRIDSRVAKLEVLT